MLSALKEDIKIAIKSAFDHEIADNQLVMNQTKKEFDGEYTFVVFPLVKVLRAKPEDLGNKLGESLVSNSPLVDNFNVVKGFLNLSLSNKFWINRFSEVSKPEYLNLPANGKKMMVEFSSPNTNKPLHLGHIRNILLGWSTSQIASANGYEVIKTQVVNDRGIAICKSMMAWQMFGEGKTPNDQDIKGDHFVGSFYVKFEQEFQKEYKTWQVSTGATEIYKEKNTDGVDKATFFKKYKNHYFNDHSSIGKATKEMLLKWEANDPETIELWKQMNSWVYEGFETTYKALGVSFDSSNYESETYKIGKDFVQEGLSKDIFYQKEDKSVWVDLEDSKMDHKIVLRSDGTSVYVTQDLGTAHMRYKDYAMDSLVYVVADEQDYHFKVLFEILKRLGEPYAENLYHLSYGMVDLPTGKMKSREGTVVDADDLIAEVIAEAKQSATERGGLEGLNESEKNDIYRKIGLAALKYFMIKVNPKKRMTFDPKESVDMQGQTGPYIQNAYVRIQSIFRRYDGEKEIDLNNLNHEVVEQEKELLVQLIAYKDVLKDAIDKYDPSLIANYAYTLAKAYHRFYHDCRILNADAENTKLFRLKLSHSVGVMLKKNMTLLGIEMPDYM